MPSGSYQTGANKIKILEASVHNSFVNNLFKSILVSFDRKSFDLCITPVYLKLCSKFFKITKLINFNGLLNFLA